MFTDTPTIVNLIGHNVTDENPAGLLRPYRRGDSYLRKHSEFEILKYEQSFHLMFEY